MSLEPKIILSIDVPGRADGGWVRWDKTLSTSCCSSAATIPTRESLTKGTIRFKQTDSERNDYLRLLSQIKALTPDIVIIEHPFLYLIAQPVGAIKAWCALHDVPWWMITPSRAKKLILNNGRANKNTVLHWAQHTYPLHPNETALTQHQADAWLYLETWRYEHENHKIALSGRDRN